MNLTGLYSASTRSMVLLAPPGAQSRSVFWNSFDDYFSYEHLISDMQKLRGRIYLADGAIGQKDLSPDGRHILPCDEKSWHLLTIDLEGRVLGCVRFLQHPSTSRFYDLHVSRAPITKCAVWGATVQKAVRAELNKANSLGYSYLETGGWAMDEEIRGTTEALRTVLSIYAWSHLTGGALGISTATERNGSASILRRLGGCPLESNGSLVPAYFDHSYNCNMELVRFDSRSPNPRYASVIEELKSTLLNIPVICPERPLWSHQYRPGFKPAVAAAIAAA